MKAAVYTRYGSPGVLELAEVAKPCPKDDEILIGVQASSVCFGDKMARRFNAVTPGSFNMPFVFWLLARLTFGLRRPRVRVLGAEISGVVEAVGEKVTRFKAGDEVFAYPGPQFGGYAEFKCMSESGTVALKPKNVTPLEAAVIPYGAVTAMLLLRKANIRPGHKVLINGASGGIGSYAVQLAKHYGASVTGTCGTPRLEFVRSLGADEVIDYRKHDFTRNGQTYDLILDVLGKSTFSRCKASLNSKGVYLLASFKTKQLLQMLLTRFRGGKKVVCALAADSPEALETVQGLVEAGAIKAHIDRTFPLEQVAMAHEYAEKDLARGSIAVAIRG